MSWVSYKLGDVCIIEKGKIGIQKAVPGAFPLVVTAEERLSHNEAHFEGNAVVIPLVSSTGHGHKSLKRIHFQSGKFAVGNILCAVMPKDESFLRADFLYRFLDLNREKELVGRMKGMANVTLPMKEIANIEIPIPPIEDQISFVQKYNLLEGQSKELNSEIEDQIGLVKQLRQAFLREAMHGKLVPQDPNDEPASVLFDKFKAEKEQLIKEKKLKKEKPLPPISGEEIPFEIPENWVWCRLGELGETNIGLTYKPSDIKEIGTPVLRANNIQNHQIVFKDLVHVSTSIRDNQYAYIGDILICVRSGSSNLIGKSAIVKRDGMSFGAFMSIYRSKFNSFISYFMMSELFKNQIDDKKSTGINQLTQDVLKNIVIPMPPFLTQKRIVTKLDELMLLCDKLEQRIKESQQQNEALLQQVLREALEPK